MVRLLSFVLVLVAFPAFGGTILSLNTPVGSMTIELYDEEKPITVANFLEYVASGRFDDSFSHRLVPGFVLQGGGFTLDGTTIRSVPTDDPIVNEYSTSPVITNSKGTLAMAKLGGDPNSATSQWFINLADNNSGTSPRNLDLQNGGFTVFGRVIEGFDVMEKFNTDFNQEAEGGPGVYNASSQLGSAFGELPLLAGSLQVQNLISTEFTVVPEPSILTLLGVGTGLAFWRVATRRTRGTSRQA